jgi:thiosulfate dehydrogenase (quinone) large subunit
MITKFLRQNVFAAGFLTLVRLYLGWKWIDAGYHKISGGFDASGFLKNAVAKPVLDSGTKEVLYPTYVSFIENFALPNAKIFNVLIPYGEFLVGLGLLLGCLTTAAMFFGVMMNFMFMFAGTVSSNPYMVLLGVLILVAGSNAGKFGADFYVLSYLRKLLKLKPAASAEQPARV